MSDSYSVELTVKQMEALIEMEASHPDILSDACDEAMQTILDVYYQASDIESGRLYPVESITLALNLIDSRALIEALELINHPRLKGILNALKTLRENAIENNRKCGKRAVRFCHVCKGFSHETECVHCGGETEQC